MITTSLILGCVSLRKSKIGFLNPKESEILRFFTRKINPRSLGSWCVKGTEESTSRVDSSVPLQLTQHDPQDLGLICLVEKRKIYFRIFFAFKNPILDFLKKGILNCTMSYTDNSHTTQLPKLSLIRLALSSPDILQIGKGSDREGPTKSTQ